MPCTVIVVFLRSVTVLIGGQVFFTPLGRLEYVVNVDVDFEKPIGRGMGIVTILRASSDSDGSGASSAGKLTAAPLTTARAARAPIRALMENCMLNGRPEYSVVPLYINVLQIFSPLPGPNYACRFRVNYMVPSCAEIIEPIIFEYQKVHSRDTSSQQWIGGRKSPHIRGACRRTRSRQQRLSHKSASRGICFRRASTGILVMRDKAEVHTVPQSFPQDRMLCTRT